MPVMVHNLKTHPEPFRALQSGNKTFEIRRDDRGFKVGDILVLEEWDPETEIYSGKHEVRTVRYILPGGFGLKEGHVAMAVVAPSAGELALARQTTA